jgi:hypothetical protein
LRDGLIGVESRQNADEPAHWGAPSGSRIRRRMARLRRLIGGKRGRCTSNAAPVRSRSAVLIARRSEPLVCTCGGSVISLRLELALPAGLKPTLCEAAREPGRRLPESPRATHAPSSPSELRGRAVLAARRQTAAAPSDRGVGTGAPQRADRAITRRRGRRPRAWGEARGPRTSQSRPRRSQKRAAA